MYKSRMSDGLSSRLKMSSKSQRFWHVHPMRKRSNLRATRVKRAFMGNNASRMKTAVMGFILLSSDQHNSVSSLALLL